MEEERVWKEVQQQQQLSTNEVPGSHYKPLQTDLARGGLRSVCVIMCVCQWVCMHMSGCIAVQ